MVNVDVTDKIIHYNMYEMPATEQDKLVKKVPHRKVIMANVKKEIQIQLRYKANFISGIVQVLIFLLIFWFFSVALLYTNPALASTRGKFLFFLSALVIVFYDSVFLYGAVNQVSRDLYNGTLETIYSLPSSRYLYYASSMLAQSLIYTIILSPFLVFLAIYSNASAMSVLMMLLVLVLAIITMVAMGVMISLMAILWKQVGSLVGVVGTLMQFVGGMVFPIDALPTFFQYLAYIFPYTYAFDLMRVYSFGDDWIPIMPVAYEWAMLVGFTIGFTLIAKILLNRVEKHAKSKGLHLL